jgi:hypothetical protein
VPRFATNESPLEIAIKGAAAGLLGTLVLTLAMQNAHHFLGDRDEEDAEASVAAPVQSAADPTERLVEKVAAGVFERDLSPDTRQTLGLGIHWGYGTFWGVAYAILQASLRLPTWLHGTLLGLAVWVIGPLGLVPAMKLSARSTGRPRSLRIVSVVLHLLYGWATAATFGLLSDEA